ncbi:hypothetical protein QE364_002832 [Nocardioides zeae]|uniref:Uncharacterized protein n=2 Tax=Nocardioides zeae TaxID=1457234 RepID=A0AAJ1X385_9ACTN|nr:hypothetical protein [Nocardioides zeae]MDQ1106611.1 hypothetical protein [Nocardioides zeae]MDR6173710.1 hypothetical protein [Nocardioides zeae]MDR6211113.1 hypothetical protein [Nocardioides zeae]
MEMLAVELTAFTRRTGSVVVAHSATDLVRGLEPGETVATRDQDDVVRVAVVADLDFDLEDTYYRLTLGEVLRLDEAELAVSTALGAGALPVRAGAERLLAAVGVSRPAHLRRVR